MGEGGGEVCVIRRMSMGRGGEGGLCDKEDEYGGRGRFV